MAKQITPPPTDPRSPPPSIPCQQRLSGLSLRPRRRKSHSKSATPYITTPSSSLLSFLATIAASSSIVDGSPVPPPPTFLCPSLEAEHVPTIAIDPQVSSSTRPSTVYPRSSATEKRLTPRSVPDRFQEGDDGVWRRVESYTLYGSTVCPSCREPTNAVSSVDDQIHDSPDPGPSVVTTTSYDISTSLPPGWNSPGDRPEGRTPLILALSLALALIICFFIIGCLFWRKNVKRKFKESEDLEMKARMRARSDDDPAEEARLMAEKDAKVKQKLWARATARWKANARYTARQRRGKRTVASTRSPHPSASATSFELRNPHREMSSTHSSRHSSPSRSSFHSHRSSMDSHHEHPLSDAQGIQASPESEPINNIPIISLSPPNLSHTSPPAYQRGQELPLHISLEGLSISDCERSKYSPSGLSSAPHSPSLYPSRPHSRRPSHNSLLAPSLGTEVRLELDTYNSPLHAAHVATDDKTILARLADLASAPPQTGSDSRIESSNPQSSAPEWHDEELEDFEQHSSSPVCRSRSSSPVGLFPPPPSKGKMAAADFLQYPLTFEEEMAALGPESGPSAPPFEAGNISDHEALAPSAPPLLDDGNDTEYASAPAWDSPPDDHEDERSNDRHSSNHSLSSGGTAAGPNPRPIEGPVTLEGTLPGYLP